MNWLVVLVASAGCTQLLGLDGTKFEFKDAMHDAPNLCDGAPLCTSSTGRSACGQLVGTGSDAGQPVRAQAPTGAACATVTSDGPCALTIYGQAMTDYVAGAATGKTGGVIDDCGRYAIDDAPTTIADLAIVVGGAAVTTTATLVFGRKPTPGTDTGVAAYVVSSATVMMWATQAAAPVTGGVLVEYSGAAGQVEKIQDTPPAGAPPATPWGMYFTGAAGFSTLDPAATSTTNGTALVVPGGGAFDLGGFRVGKTCKQTAVQAVAGTMIEVTLQGC